MSARKRGRLIEYGWELYLIAVLSACVLTAWMGSA